MSAKDAKDPAYAASERLSLLMAKCSCEGILKQLDVSATFSGLTGSVSTAPVVAKTLSRFCELAGKALVVESTSSYKDMKTAATVFRVHDLRVQDTITINHSLLITKIVRKRIPSAPNSTPNSKQLTKHFLRSLIDGPAPRPNQRYPVLDFSYKHIECARDLFLIAPRSGKRRVLSTTAKVETQVSDNQSKDDEDKILIKGKTREGDSAAYTFDRREMRVEEREDSDDDDLCGSKKRREVYEASAAKLCNNNIASPARIDEALKRLCLNAFYFLTWVDLSFNKLTEIPDFSQFPIIILYLHANEIKNINEVKKLKCLEELQSLTLYGNPIQDQIANYKYSVLNLLESGRPTTIKKFDFAVLSERDQDNMKTLRDFTEGICTRDPRDMH